MRRSDKELETLAVRLAADDSDLDESVVAESTEDLRAVADAADAAVAAEAAVREAVRVARAHGRSWTRIGVALGVSRQAARQRFGELVEH